MHESESQLYYIIHVDFGALTRARVVCVYVYICMCVSAIIIFRYFRSGGRKWNSRDTLTRHAVEVRDETLHSARGHSSFLLRVTSLVTAHSFEEKKNNISGVGSMGRGGGEGASRARRRPQYPNMAIKKTSWLHGRYNPKIVNATYIYLFIYN